MRLGYEEYEQLREEVVSEVRKWMYSEGVSVGEERLGMENVKEKRDDEARCEREEGRCHLKNFDGKEEEVVVAVAEVAVDGAGSKESDETAVVADREWKKMKRQRKKTNVDSTTCCCCECGSNLIGCLLDILVDVAGSILLHSIVQSASANASVENLMDCNSRLGNHNSLVVVVVAGGSSAVDSPFDQVVGMRRIASLGSTELVSVVASKRHNCVLLSSLTLLKEREKVQGVP